MCNFYFEFSTTSKMRKRVVLLIFFEILRLVVHFEQSYHRKNLAANTMMEGGRMYFDLTVILAAPKVLHEKNISIKNMD